MSVAITDEIEQWMSEVIKFASNNFSLGNSKKHKASDVSLKEKWKICVDDPFLILSLWMICLKEMYLKELVICRFVWRIEVLLG